MSAQKLMDLRPGNMLELEIPPEKAIALMVNDKCIGRGELIKIGETLGLRILEIG